jgi:hypothetical protein
MNRKCKDWVKENSSLIRKQCWRLILAQRQYQVDFGKSF